MEEAQDTRYAAPRLNPRMTSQMNISLPIELHQKLRDLAWQDRLPLSHLCRNLIQAGIRLRESEAGEKSKAATGGD